MSISPFNNVDVSLACNMFSFYFASKHFLIQRILVHSVGVTVRISRFLLNYLIINSINSVTYVCMRVWLLIGMNSVAPIRWLKLTSKRNIPHPQSLMEFNMGIIADWFIKIDGGASISYVEN